MCSLRWDYAVVQALGAVQNRWIGGKMKNYAIASLALAVSVAITPFALADSFGYKASDSSITAGAAFDRGHTPTAFFFPGTADRYSTISSTQEIRGTGCRTGTGSLLISAATNSVSSLAEWAAVTLKAAGIFILQTTAAITPTRKMPKARSSWWDHGQL